MTEIIVARPVIPAIFAFHDIAAPLSLSTLATDEECLGSPSSGSRDLDLMVDGFS